MAKFQWTAASETLGNAPALLTNLLTADGQSLNDWQIVAEAGASGGQVIKKVGSGTARRFLTLPGVTATGRIDMRGRMYCPSTSTGGLHFAVVNAKGTGASDSYAFLCRRNNTAFQINKYATSFASIGSTSGLSTTGFIGWYQWRYTYDPDYVANGTTLHRLAVWKDGGGGSDTTPDAVVTGNDGDANVNGTAVGFGSSTDGPDWIDWITVGTGTDDADVTPAAGAIEFVGAATASAVADGELTTQPAVIKGVRVQLGDGTTPDASLTGLSVRWWDSGSATGTPDYESDTETTDETGTLEVDLDAVTALDLADNGYLLVFKNGATLDDDVSAAGRVPIVSLS